MAERYELFLNTAYVFELFIILWQSHFNLLQLNIYFSLDEAVKWLLEKF